LGRWPTTDPIGFSGGLNLYAYVGNRPCLQADPYGLAAGDYYGTPEQAACAALGESNPTSISENREYAGAIYEREGGGYTYTTPWPGSDHLSDPIAIYIGDLTKVVAEYHTHANYSTTTRQPTTKKCDAWKSDQFSSSDFVGINQFMEQYRSGQSYKAFLGTPSGQYSQMFPLGGNTGAVLPFICP
jgi:hypothetical protein